MPSEPSTASPGPLDRALRPTVVLSVLIGCAVLTGAGAALLPIHIVTVRGTSMNPTLCSGDTLLVIDEQWTHPPQVGEIHVLADPDNPDSLLVKRVVGVPGQSVRIADGVLLLDERPVLEPWIDSSTMPGVYSAPVVIGESSVYVLGDDRETSLDSRTFGPVPQSALTSRVIGRVASRCER
jgi:signal peptidase I